MAISFDQAGVDFDSADYTFDGTFIGVSAAAVFLSVFITARNIAAASSANTAAPDPFYALSGTARNKVEV